MSVTNLRFNNQNRPEFFKELRSRVNGYFKENNIDKYANTQMKIKTGFMIALYFVPLGFMLSTLVTELWLNYLLWTLMGLGMSGIGLSVMHDANHGAYSKNQKVNKALGGLLNFLGGFPMNWKIQHNVLHHTYTNIDGHDEDIDTPLLRFSPTQEHKWYHRFQVIYGPLMYGLMTISWLINKDFGQLNRYEKMGLIKSQNTTYGKALTKIIINKIWYVALTIVGPLLLVEVPWYHVVIGFVWMQLMSGWILAFIFQMAHVIEETNFYKLEAGDTSVENHWAIHQLNTTANFAQYNLPLSWYVGGLNYQIEHHLFPNICHIHYRKLSKIVKSTAEEYGIPYHQHKTFVSAVRSHFSLLWKLGNNKIQQPAVA